MESFLQMLTLLFITCQNAYIEACLVSEIDVSGWILDIPRCDWILIADAVNLRVGLDR